MTTYHQSSRTLDRLRAEFTEMPGLRLTIDQVHRFCGIGTPECKDMLEELVHEHFLCVKSDGRYGRVTDGHPASDVLVMSGRAS